MSNRLLRRSMPDADKLCMTPYRNKFHFFQRFEQYISPTHEQDFFFATQCLTRIEYFAEKSNIIVLARNSLILAIRFIVVTTFAVIMHSSIYIIYPISCQK